MKLYRIKTVFTLIFCYYFILSSAESSSENDLTLECLVNYTLSEQCITKTIILSQCSSINLCIEWAYKSSSVGGKIILIEVPETADGEYNHDCIGDLDTTLLPYDKLIIYSRTFTHFNCNGEKFLSTNMTLGSNTTFVFENIGITNIFGVDPVIYGDGGLISINNEENRPANYSEHFHAPKVQLINIYVNSSTTGSNGGFLATMYMDVEIKNSTFENCFCNGNGGVFYSGDNITTVTVTDSDFNENNSELNGGCIYATNIVSTGTKYISNQADLGGSLLSLRSMIVIDCIFIDNMGASDGGSIYGYGYLTMVNGSTFINSYAGGEGGSIFAAWKLFIYGSTFIASTATYGGTISGYNNTVISESNFESSYSSYYGGVIYYNGNNIAIDKSKFYNCIGSSYGGVISNNNNNETTYFSITDSLFLNNTAKVGGVIDAFGSTVFNLSGTVFKNNIANRIAGSINFDEEYPLNFTSGVFLNSTSKKVNSYTFNDVMLQNINIVNVSTNILNNLNTIYSVPLVLDSSSPYVQAIGVTGECLNGLATINQNGIVTNCACFSGFSGSSCDQTNFKIKFN